MEAAESESIGEVFDVDPATKKTRCIIGVDPGPHCGLVVMQKTPDEGWVVTMRWTFEMTEATPGKMHVHWAKECARMMNDPNMRKWFELANFVVIERQYTAPGSQPLPSFLVMTNLCAQVELLWNGKAVLVGSNEVKAAYFTEAQRKSYAKRKQCAELMSAKALARAKFFDPTQRVHDQADAFLIATYWLQHIYKRPAKLSMGYRKRKVADEPKQPDPDYKPRRGRPRKQ